VDSYDSTIDESRQVSLEKALLILAEQQHQQELEQIRLLQCPDVSLSKGVIGLLASLGGLTILWVFFSMLRDILSFPSWTRILATAFVVVIMGVIHLKKAIIYCVKLYQHYAPSRIRLACVFEPSCSVYMLMAIDKYGGVKGTIKGFRRLLRCHFPNGGEDNP
jgi:putative component of membrane protein insertase Oxa1/YidC/SpoIIIJ protein YidD